MLIAIALVLGAACLWEVLSGIGLIGWGLVELCRQVGGGK